MTGNPEIIPWEGVPTARELLMVVRPENTQRGSLLPQPPYTSSKLGREPAAGKKFSGGALAASDGAMHRPVVSAAIRRFSSKKEGIPNRFT